jgi:hypothetical protein
MDFEFVKFWYLYVISLDGAMMCSGERLVAVDEFLG